MRTHWLRNSDTGNPIGRRSNRFRLAGGKHFPTSLPPFSVNFENFYPLFSTNGMSRPASRAHTAAAVNCEPTDPGFRLVTIHLLLRMLETQDDSPWPGSSVRTPSQPFYELYGLIPFCLAAPPCYTLPRQQRTAARCVSITTES
jgi:hypothetical protein